jgi:hypothetical protein
VSRAFQPPGANPSARPSRLCQAGLHANLTSCICPPRAPSCPSLSPLIKPNFSQFLACCLLYYRLRRNGVSRQCIIHGLYIGCGCVGLSYLGSLSPDACSMLIAACLKAFQWHDGLPPPTMYIFLGCCNHSKWQPCIPLAKPCAPRACH